MERTDILALSERLSLTINVRSWSPSSLSLTINVRSMGELKLYGMRSAYDEVMAAGIKRQHEPTRIVGDLLDELRSPRSRRGRSSTR